MDEKVAVWIENGWMGGRTAGRTEGWHSKMRTNTKNRKMDGEKDDPRINKA